MSEIETLKVEIFDLIRQIELANLKRAEKVKQLEKLEKAAEDIRGKVE